MPQNVLVPFSLPALNIPPISTSETDVSNFDEEFTKEEAHDSLVVSNMTSTMVEKSAFVGFTYNNRPSLTGPLG